MTTETEHLTRARLALEGLSIGDAFGDQFFLPPDTARALLPARTLPKPPWMFTDDTHMALSLYDILRRYQDIHQDELASSFARHYDPARGYGPAMHRLLTRIAAGDSWEVVSTTLFDGQGSYGNGAAMRVAPLGAYFADDLDQVVEQAHKSAQITHAHPEGIAGAIAVAVAAAFAVRLQGEPAPNRADFLSAILPFVPDSEVKSGILRARDIRSQVVDHVIAMLGNGYQMTAQATVPFTLWCAGECLPNFEDALWLTASALGDVDTNCAIVGGIVALYVGQTGIPHGWLESREPLPAWAFA